MKLRDLNSKCTCSMAVALFFFMVITSVKAQNSQFSYTQYMDNLTPLNPAYSLLDKTGSINTLARKQWIGVDGAPTTFMINGNLPIASINGSSGLTVINDQFAIEHQIEVNAYFAKAIQVGPKDYLGVSINAGLRDYTANYSTLGAEDPLFRNDIRETKPNIGFGVIYFTDWYYFGVSVPEFTITNLGTASIQSNNNFRNHYYFSGALITDITEDIKFKPATLISYSNGGPLVADVSGTLYTKETLGLGINYRTNNEMAGILILNIDVFHIGYSYQFGTASNKLGGFNMPTHEVTLSCRFGKGASNPKLL